jgi:hypothetical protein
LNTARGTSGLTYATLSSTSNILTFYSQLIGPTSKIYINSSDGTSETAPLYNAYYTIFSNVAWSISTAVAVGTAGTVNALFKFISKESGTDSIYNSTSGTGCYVEFSTRDNPIYTGSTDTINPKYFKDIDVYYNDVIVETFENISYNRKDSNWFMKVINATESNGGSSYIEVEWYQPEVDGSMDIFTDWTTVPTSGLFLIPDGDIYFSNGNDGIISSPDSLFISAIDLYSNPDSVDPHILVTSGISSSSVINAAISMIEGTYRKDILYVVDPPLGLTVQEVADWHNGKYNGTNAPGTPINSYLATMYWSWMLDYDEDNSQYVWCPPSVWMVAKFAEVDNNYGPWSIPAGTTRGILNANSLEYNPAQDERDLLYSITGNLNVNPIVNFPSVGLTVFGQKTLLRDDTPKNRLNVVRMLIYVKKLARKALKKYIFEPNIQSTWNKVTAEFTNILEPIKNQEGITEYQILFDRTTTTSSLINQHKMSGIVRIKPAFSIEAIEVTFSTVGSDISLS